jgi:uncharacterized protein (TIGR03118 family)
MARAQAAKGYTQSNLISNGSVNAQQTDTQLVNPWGVAIGHQTPFWINAAGSGLSEVYDAGANKQFSVKIPSAGGPNKNGSPTGIVFNSSTTDFALPSGGASLFIFDALDGTISAWNTNVTDAKLVVDNSATGAAYTGLAIINNGTANYLLAADLTGNKIDVFDSKFAPATLSGNFTDPSIPAGFAPFNVHVIKNQVFVMYGQQNANGVSAFPPMAGTGYVSVFDNTGKFVARAISGGHLDAPWGLALAPASFGEFGGDLLVGNFGDGTISAYDPTSFVLKGQLNDLQGHQFKTRVSGRSLLAPMEPAIRIRSISQLDSARKEAACSGRSRQQHLRAREISQSTWPKLQSPSSRADPQQCRSTFFLQTDLPCR